MPTNVDQQVDVLIRGCEAVYTRDELRARLQSGKPMRVKLGLDPTAPDIHLGHTVVLRKLRQFQDLGHKAVLIIGDATAMIGDPTGRAKTRPQLTEDEINRNAETYLQQAGRVLDTSPDKLELKRNSEWLSPMTLGDVLKLMSRMTVARMLERDTFAVRQKAGKEIYLHELLYPLMQARDSVAIEASVELGGTEQTFNNLCGRDLQRIAGQQPQVVMVLPLLMGIDGREKMSKSLGNYVAINDPPGEMFGKLMRIPDELLRSYFELLTDVPAERVAALTDPTVTNPRDAKEELAKTIIARYHTSGQAESAADEFRRVHGGGGGGLPDDIPELTLPADCMSDGKIGAIDLITACGFAKSRSDAKRLIAERGVRLNGEVIGDISGKVSGDVAAKLTVKSGDVLQRGKRKFVRLVVP